MAAWKAMLSGSSWRRRAPSTGGRSAPPPTEAPCHVHRWNVRIVEMRDQRNAGSPEPRIGFGAGNLLAEFRRELAEHGRHGHAHPLEPPSFHDRHPTSAPPPPPPAAPL